MDQISGGTDLSWNEERSDTETVWSIRAELFHFLKEQGRRTELCVCEREEENREEGEKNVIEHVDC